MNKNKKQKYQLQEVLLNKIKDNPKQVREMEKDKDKDMLLKNSIKEVGLINPPTLLKKGNEFIVMSGHRRVLAFKQMKDKKTIPAFVVNKKTKALEKSLAHENLIREDLDYNERAFTILNEIKSQIKAVKNVDEALTLINMLKNYKRRDYIPEHKRGDITKEFGNNDIFILDKILKSFGISENNATCHLNITKLPKLIRDDISFGGNGEGKLSIKKAEQLARIKDSEYQNYVYQKALAYRTTAKHIQALADIYVKKVNEGSWKGFEKYKSVRNYNAKFKDDMFKLEELSNKSEELSANISSFSVDTLLKLEATLEKENFISSIISLKRVLDILRHKIDEKLADRGIQKTKKKIDNFYVMIMPHSSVKRGLRYSFPTSITKDLNLDDKKRYKLELKIEGLREIKK